MADSERIQNPRMASEQSSVVTTTVVTGSRECLSPPPLPPQPSDSYKLGIGERAFSAAGAAFLSAIIVNPLDVAKTRLQAQATGVDYSHPLSNMTRRMACFGPNMMFADLRCSPSCTRAGFHGTVSLCPADCFRYKGTLDVLYKIIQHVGGIIL